MNNTTNTGGPAFPHDPDAQLNTLPAQIRAGEDAVIANLQSMGLARTERDRPAALAASEASQVKAKRENALRDAAPDLLDALQSIAECCNEDQPARAYASRQTEIRGIARAAIAKATGDTP